MSAFGAFSRSRVVLKSKTDVGLAMKKWWAKYIPDEGQVSIDWFTQCCYCLAGDTRGRGDDGPVTH